MTRALWEVVEVEESDPVPEGAFRPHWLPDHLVLMPLPEYHERRRVAEVIAELEPDPFASRTTAEEPRLIYLDEGHVVEDVWVVARVHAPDQRDDSSVFVAGSSGEHTFESMVDVVEALREEWLREAESLPPWPNVYE